METSLRHFYRSVVEPPMEESLYGNGIEDGLQSQCERGLKQDSTCPESILNFILDADKAFKTQEDKLDARCRLGVPQDPRGWTTDEVDSWITWLCSTFDLPVANDLAAKLRDFSLDGRMLAQLSMDDFCNLFGPNGDVMYENFRRWLNAVSPESQEIQDELFEVQNNIFRFEDIKHKLIGTLTNTQSFLERDWGSDMSSPPLSPPMSDDFPSQDIDFGQSCCASIDGPASLPWYPRASPAGYPMVEDDVSASSLLIEPPVMDGSPTVLQKRRRGRPRKPKPPKQKRSQPILYKFILSHLNNPSMRSVVEWVNKQNGVFRFHSARKDEFAEMWGRYKGNREQMTYQNMARALRNYTRGKTRIMERVKRKLHYKFCPEFIR